MLSDIKKYSQPKDYKFELKYLAGYYNGKAIYRSLGYIQGVTTNVTINWKMETFDELKLEISRTVYDMAQNKTSKNKYWDLCKTKYVIEVLNNIDDVRQRFLIDTVHTVINQQSQTKQITAYSLEEELTYIIMRDYNSYGKTEDTMDIQYTDSIENIVNDVLSRYVNNRWSFKKNSLGLADIDAKTAVKRLAYDFDTGSVRDFFNYLQKSFNCIFIYDTINQEISIRDLTIYSYCPKCGESEHLHFRDRTVFCSNPDCPGIANTDGTKTFWSASVYGKDTGLYLSDKKYIYSFKEEVGMDQLVTRLYVYGANGLSINTASQNLTGQSYIENYRYFYENNYFSEGLKENYEKYMSAIQACEGQFNQLLAKQSDIAADINKINIGTRSTEELFERFQSISEQIAAILADSDILTKRKKEQLDKVFENNQLEPDEVTAEYGLYALTELDKVLQANIDAVVEVSKIIDGSSSISTDEKNEFHDEVYTRLYKKQDHVQTLMKKLKQQIEEKKKETDEVEKQKEELRSNLSVETYMTADQIKELYSYGQEKEYTNSDFTVDENYYIGSPEYQEVVDRLYQDGLNELNRAYKPPIDFKVDVVNFLRSIQCQHDWDKLSLGDIIHISHPNMTEQDNIVRIVGILWGKDGDTMNVSLSNNDGFKSAHNIGKGLFHSVATSETTLRTNKKKWNNSKVNAVNTVANIMENGLNKVINSLRLGGNQDIQLTQYGILVRSTLPELAGHEIKISNGCIAFTTDGWSTCSLGITPDGVIADNLIGRVIIGQTLNIISPIFDENGNQTGEMNFKADADKLSIDNGYLTITSKNGSGLTFDAETGMLNKVTLEDGTKLESGFGAKEGFYFSVNGKKKLSYSTEDETLRLDGTAIIRKLYLLGLEDDVASAVNTLTVNAKNNTAIKGDFLELKGVRVKKGNTTTFEITNNGDVTGRDCEFRNGTFSGDFVAGNITSDTSIQVETDVYTGNAIFIGQDKDGNYKDGRHTLTFSKQASIYTTSDNDNLHISSAGGIDVNGNLIMTQKDLRNLEDKIKLEIKDLQSQIDKLKAGQA